MLEYESFLWENIPSLKSDLERSPSPRRSKIERAREYALHYLEMACTSKYGYPGEAHYNGGGKYQSHSVRNIPTCFDSALLLPILAGEGIDSLVTDSLVCLLRKCQRQTGFWSHFSKGSTPLGTCFPDDIDSTSVAAMGLFLTGQLTISECRDIGKEIIAHIKTPDKDCSVLPWASEDNPKLDAGSLINFLWLFSSAGMESDSYIQPAYGYLEDFIDNLVKTQCTQEKPCEMSYYTNKYFVYFLLSRYLKSSTLARDKFGSKVEGLLKMELEHLAGKWYHGETPEALDISCLILAVTNMKLHCIRGQSESHQCVEDVDVCEINVKILELMRVLLEKQNVDGSFPEWIVFHWDEGGYYGGSRAITTGFALAAIGAVQREILNDARES